jgi:hypothetical protein
LAGRVGGSSRTPSTPPPAGAEPASAESGVPGQSQTEAASANPDSASATESSAAAGSRPAPASVLDAPPREAEAIDLVEAAGGAVAKRVAPVIGALALLAVLFVVLRRRR